MIRAFLFLKAFFLDEREHPAMHRSGQGLFLPHANFKTKRDDECKAPFVLRGNDLYIILIRHEN